MSDASVAHELTLISRLLKSCSTKWSIYLPHGIPPVKKPAKAEGRDRGVSDEEIKALISATQSVTLKSIITFALETAMRRSEISNLEWKYVNTLKQSAKLLDTKMVLIVKCHSL